MVIIIVFASILNIKTLPRDWNSKNYIEPPAGENEKEKELKENVKDAIDDDRRNREASGLVRTGKFFGGLINDIKRQWRSEILNPLKVQNYHGPLSRLYFFWLLNGLKRPEM